ncbi:geranyl transferase [Paenibacillus sp. PK3_47]|uniref:polyprenyl synthetase family protein n=1 Tax=Paenibacillus sp. PK3_47 TaxID=2072642 RepID=UPI00201DC218|nr:polyprenyl synthetase family protein [Paenibacillus sp. PK3_47]UQZ36748.1 geranyl transferase [Paenibacillus sp. PK3_47]
MSMVYTQNAGRAYQLAEQKAGRYFAALDAQVKEKGYVPVLTADFNLWKKNHIHRTSWLSFFSRNNRKPGTTDYQKYLQWLKYTGKLDDYLDRSISYIYMRDLGKALDSPQTAARIRRMVEDIKTQFLPGTAPQKGGQPDIMNLAQLYRWGQKEGVEAAVIWVIGKLKSVSANLPQEMNAEHAQRKLIKIIIGVVMNALEELGEGVTREERSRQLDQAIRLGYSYGLTYPFIDDLLDSGALTAAEKEQYSRMIRQALLSGTVPEPGEWTGAKLPMIHYVHSELREAFEYIKSVQRPDTEGSFFERSYVFFHSQEVDRAKSLAHDNYTNEELYLPVILKSASSRLIVRSVINAPEDEGFDHRTFHYGLYNQLADDFADMFEDMKEGAVTPYTYYLKYRDTRSDLLNPFELYWTVISHLLHNVYASDPKTREVILDRVINGLKRSKERLGLAKYKEVMDIFASGSPGFNELVQRLVTKADDVDFFDKLLRDQLIMTLKNNGKDKDEFHSIVTEVREEINSQLLIEKPAGMPPMKNLLIDAANYSLNGDGKRLRPILTWVMGVREYGLQAADLIPLLRSLEYMHTASLIFDDLPSQDNASTRRGRDTLHEVHDPATAELTGLFLIQKATEEQASLERFDPETVLKLMKYSARKTEDMCVGQAMDLHSKGRPLTLAELNEICFYKTGIAFEAALVMPAILARVNEQEIAALKKYAYHAGIAFQIKDDLLDTEGDQSLLGKPVGQDAGNNTSTFVTVLGLEGARQEMWEHYCLATDALGELPRGIPFLKHLLNYLINREH